MAVPMISNIHSLREICSLFFIRGQAAHPNTVHNWQISAHFGLFKVIHHLLAVGFINLINTKKYPKISHKLPYFIYFPSWLIFFTPFTGVRQPQMAMTD
jgi:hypothetical protein